MCDCLTDSSHEHWSEWNDNFSGFTNVRIVPNKKQYKEQERRLVHYPLVRSIASGALCEKGFNDYRKDSVLVLCNLKIPILSKESANCDWVDKRPDIVCLTSQGKVFVIECKAGAGLDNRKDLEKDIKSFVTLRLFASVEANEYKDDTLSNSFHRFEQLYDKRYPSHLLFPSFEYTVKRILRLTTRKRLSLWADKVMECIRTEGAYWGFAIDRPIDDRSTQALKFFKNRFEYHMGHHNRLFFFSVRQDGAFDVIEADRIG